MLEFELKSPFEEYLIKLSNLKNLFCDYKHFKYRINKMDNMYIKVKNKYQEYEKEDKSGFSEYQKLKKKYKGQKINYYFHYHVIDTARVLLKNDKISNAWLKSYEIYTTFDLIDSFEEKEFNTFHLCELPGQFILSLQHYIKKRTEKKLNWMAQSFVERERRIESILPSGSEERGTLSKPISWGNPWTPMGTNIRRGRLKQLILVVLLLAQTSHGIHSAATPPIIW